MKRTIMTMVLIATIVAQTIAPITYKWCKFITAIAAKDETSKYDTNGNGSVEIADAILLARYVAELEVDESYILDINNDNIVNAMDVIEVLWYLAFIADEDTPGTTTETTMTTTTTTKDTTKATSSTTTTTKQTTQITTSTQTTTTEKTTTTSTQTTTTEKTTTTSTTTEITETTTITTYNFTTETTEIDEFVFPPEFDEVLDDRGYTMSTEHYKVLMEYVKLMGWENYEYGWSSEPISGALIVPDRFYCTNATAFMYIDPAEDEDFVSLAEKYGWDISNEYVDKEFIDYFNEYMDWTFCWKWSDNEDPEQDSVMKREDFMYFSNVIYNWNIPIEASNGNWRWPGFYVINMDAK